MTKKFHAILRSTFIQRDRLLFELRVENYAVIDNIAVEFAPGLKSIGDGTLYVSEEYGPCLYQFQRDGKLIRRITLPEGVPGSPNA